MGDDHIDHNSLRMVLSDYAVALVNGEYDIGDVLYDLSDQCVEILGVDGAGVCLSDGRGQLSFLSATDGRAARLEEEQVAQQQGPCMTAYDTGKVVTVDDLAADDRWPAYRQVALDLGYRSVVGVPMPVRRETIGALDLYRDRPGPWPPDVLEIAGVLSNMATGYVAMSRALEDAQVLNTQLQHALESRIVVEQAKGVLAARADVTPAEAFELIRTHARTQRRRVQEVAARVVDGSLELTVP